MIQLRTVLGVLSLAAVAGCVTTPTDDDESTEIAKTSSPKTTTPKPAVTISANPKTNLAAFEQSTLTWSTKNATSCTASGEDYFGDPTWSGSEPTSGTYLTPGITVPSQTYTLTCTGAGGKASASVTIEMNPNDPCDGCWDY